MPDVKTNLSIERQYVLLLTPGICLEFFAAENVTYYIAVRLSNDGVVRLHICIVRRKKIGEHFPIVGSRLHRQPVAPVGLAFVQKPVRPFNKRIDRITRTCNRRSKRYRHFEPFPVLYQIGALYQYPHLLTKPA